MEKFFGRVGMGTFNRVCRVLLLVAVAGGLAFAQTSPDRQSALQAILRQLKPELASPEGSPSIKCGASLVAWAFIHRHELPALAKKEIAQLLQRSPMEKDTLSPSGRFRIHYDTSTVNTPALISTGPFAQRIENTYEQYVDSVARIFDECWTREIDSLGYSPPPPDGQEGGGPEYDIYIEALGAGEFGSTFPSEDVQAAPWQRFATYITIDNDFRGLRTPGMNGLKITAAHEFFHAIQEGAYGVWNTVPNSDFYFYELSAVWMEHVLYPSIHDYLFDVPSYFQGFRDSQNRSYSFTIWLPPWFMGYERSIWAHFLAKRFTGNVMREIWEGMRTDPFLQSATKVIQRHGSTIEAEFALFSSWNFFTADRADTVRFYNEGKYYPRFLPNATAAFGGLSAAVTTSGFPLSTQLFQFAIPGDTITAVVANVEVNQAIESASVPRSLEVKLVSGQANPPYQKLSKGYTIGFSTDRANAWRTMYLESSTRANANAAPDPSPNPFRLSKDSRLALPMSGTKGSSARIYLLSSSLDLVFSGDYSVVESFGNRLAYVPAADMQSRVSSGIYFVVARCDDAELTWKVAIVQ